MSEDKNPDQSKSRRRFLKAAGATIGASVIPATASAKSTDSTAKSDDQLSADMVKLGKPETAREFVRKTVHTSDTDNVSQAYSNLSPEQVDLVRDAYDDLSSAELTITSASKSNGFNIASTGSATYRRFTAGQKAYTFTVGIDYDVSGGDIVDGTTTANFDWWTSSIWHYERIKKGEPHETTDDSTGYTAIGQFMNSVGGVELDTEYPKIEITGDSDGNIDAEKTLLESV
ncbi:hypothetical protein C455_09182 [Haloferax larsenii JCM 13917]|nr:twin-arginine translocation signal domain-containing protein [Haloferax larsenii]ELZ79747.1 hypothetical protein C455_09182 [Haloferax larsenii JCM 13917]